MAKKAFEKREAQQGASYTAAALYWMKKFNEWSSIQVYKELVQYREKQADLYKLKFRVSFVFVILEALVIWILAYFL